MDSDLKKYDILRMYYGEDYVVCDGITIHQPTIQEYEISSRS